jgi:hypothetical protein
MFVVLACGDVAEMKKPLTTATGPNTVVNGGIVH